ncbi:Hypothetical_protein [Hexamita inflata]|uniref:Hypothetical_protein n=1 Tax=Hexamita inflata TaxID=28002 RepID=A0AA86PT61_9EUKA|nr:Hypothetical protein HINF_LOCUS28690 [Hexamita inflata]
MLEQLITFTLVILQAVKDHDFTNIQAYTTQSNECQFGRLRFFSRNCNFVDTAINVLSNFMLVEDIQERLGINVNIPTRAPEYVINLIGTHEVPQHLVNVMKLFAQRAVQLVTDSKVSSLGRGELSYELMEFIEDRGLQTFIPLQAYKLSTRVIATKSDKNSQKSTKLARMIVQNSKYGDVRLE